MEYDTKSIVIISICAVIGFILLSLGILFSEIQIIKEEQSVYDKSDC